MTIHNVSAADLPLLFRRLELERLDRVQAALFEAAEAGVAVVAKAAPVDMSETRRSVHAQRLGQDASRILVDAPHAGIVEMGSRPHWPPLQPLVEWVRRHQGLYRDFWRRRRAARIQIKKNRALVVKHAKAAYQAVYGRRKPAFGLSRIHLYQAHVAQAASLRASTRTLRHRYRL